MKIIKNNKAFFALCFVTYMTSYLCRLNLSLALEKMGEGLNVTSSNVLAVLGTSFFVVYSLGQLFSGVIGDRINPRRYVAVAMTGTVVVNITISVVTSFKAILLLWCVNAVFQSMLWGPIVRMVSAQFPPEAKNKLSFGMCVSQIAGYMLAWGGLGQVLVGSEWNLYFLIPGLIAIVVALMWWYVVSAEKQISEALPDVEKPKPTLGDICWVMNRDRLWILCFVNVICGIIKESLSMWAPVIMMILLGIEVRTSLFLLMLLPLGQLLGASVSAFLVEKLGGRLQVVYTIEFIFMIIACIPLFITKLPAFMIIVLMMFVSAMITAVGNLSLSMLPMSYVKEGMVSTFAAGFDFCSYIGSAVVSFLLAGMLSGQSLTPLITMWITIAVVSLVSISFVPLQNITDKRA